MRKLVSVDGAMCCLFLLLYLKGLEVAVVGGTALKPDLSIVIVDQRGYRLLGWFDLEPLKFVLVT